MTPPPSLAALGIIIANRKKPELAEEPTLAPVAMVDTPAAAPAAVAPIGKAKVCCQRWSRHSLCSVNQFHFPSVL